MTHDNDDIYVGRPVWPLILLPLTLAAYIIFAFIVGG